MSCYKLIITIIIAVSQKVKVSFEEGLSKLKIWRIIIIIIIIIKTLFYEGNTK